MEDLIMAALCGDDRQAVARELIKLPPGSARRPVVPDHIPKCFASSTGRPTQDCASSSEPKFAHCRPYGDACPARFAPARLSL